MSILQLAQIIIGSILSLGVLIAGAGYGMGKWYEGKNARTKSEYDLLITRLEALQKICEQQQIDINRNHEDLKKHTQEIGRLQGVNEEKDKKIKELLDLLANRDPSFNEYVQYSRNSIEELKQKISSIYNHLQVPTKLE